MAIKRLTIELDDVTDVAQPTTSPPALMPQQEVSGRDGPTEIPSKQTDYNESSVDPSTPADSSPEVIGRTVSDLVYTFMNRPEFMATLFVGIAFLISVARLQKVSDLWITGAMATALNVAWFGILGLRKLIAWRTGK